MTTAADADLLAEIINEIVAAYPVGPNELQWVVPDTLLEAVDRIVMDRNLGFDASPTSFAGHSLVTVTFSVEEGDGRDRRQGERWGTV